MKLEVGKTYRTRDGSATGTVLAINLKSSQPCAVVIHDKDGNDEIEMYSRDGSYYSDCIDDLDLVEMPDVKLVFTAIDFDQMNNNLSDTAARELAEKIGGHAVVAVYEDDVLIRIELLKD